MWFEMWMIRKCIGVVAITVYYVLLIPASDIRIEHAQAAAALFQKKKDFMQDKEWFTMETQFLQSFSLLKQELIEDAFNKYNPLVAKEHPYKDQDFGDFLDYQGTHFKCSLEDKVGHFVYPPQAVLPCQEKGICSHLDKCFCPNSIAIAWILIKATFHLFSA
ncbi:hypothetical protein F5146DRAFT_995281 [Armillaria mellea]|nr:hypothetical protein F5146DRAFT_995281 [Armillaria mellea]